MHIYTSHTHTHTRTLSAAPKWSNINRCRTLLGNDGDMMSASRVKKYIKRRRVDGETVAMELVLNDNEAIVKKILNTNSRKCFFFSMNRLG